MKRRKFLKRTVSFSLLGLFAPISISLKQNDELPDYLLEKCKVVEVNGQKIVTADVTKLNDQEIDRLIAGAKSGKIQKLLTDGKDR